MPPQGYIVKPLDQRFAAKMTRGGANECWPWEAFVDKAGYGRIRIGPGRQGEAGYAHRVSYELHVGPIPEGLCLDHLCRNRRCVNPAHLEPVTLVENFRRGAPGGQGWNRGHRSTMCKRGHTRADHAYCDQQGRVIYCRTCRREKRAAGEWS